MNPHRQRVKNWMKQPLSNPTWQHGNFVISTDLADTNLDVVCGFLATSYWAGGIPRADLEQSIEASLVYNLLNQAAERRQIGFARVLTDGVRFAWLSDVFVLDDYRGRGLGKWLVQMVMADPRIERVRRWVLATQDAHGLYRQHGWEDVPSGRYLQRFAVDAERVLGVSED